MRKSTKYILDNLFEGKKLDDFPDANYKTRIVDIEKEWQNSINLLLDTFQTPEEKERYKNFRNRT